MKSSAPGSLNALREACAWAQPGADGRRMAVVDVDVLADVLTALDIYREVADSIDGPFRVRSELNSAAEILARHEARS